MPSLLEFRDSTRILNCLASFHIFHSCSILVYSIDHTGFLLHLGGFQHCNFGDFVWRTQVQTGVEDWTGVESSSKSRILFSMLQYFREKVSKLWHGNSRFAFHKKFLGFTFFLILFSRSTQLFKNQLKPEAAARGVL